MAKYTGKIVLLLIPCLITTCLLTYCLISDSWVSIDETRLKNITELYQQEFDAFNQSLFGTRAAAAPRVVLKAAHVPDEMIKVTTTTTTASSSSTPNKTPNDIVHGADYTDEDYTEENEEMNYLKKRLKRNVKGENLFKAKSKTKILPDDEDDDHDPELDSDVDPTEEDAQTTAAEIDQQQQQHHPMGPGLSPDRIDYIYVTKLWPFVKYKSLYSECVEYHKIKLKMSLSYLTTEKKEPIVGDLHYYDNTAYFPNINDDSPATCAKKSMIYCSFTKTCKYGKSCDGVPDCEDQSDEQMCDQDRVCDFKNDITGFRCDNKCWHYWNKCDLTPNCFDLSDETSSECTANRLELISVQSSKGETPQPVQNTSSSTAQKVANTVSAAFSFINNDHMSFTLGHNKFEPAANCFREYFNFKSAKLIKKDTLKHLSQQLADNVQETNNLNYHLQLIYSLSFMGALVFCVLALVSMMFVICFGKLCFQCPFWFFGFFQILAWLACLSGLMTFMYQFYANKQKSLDPNVQLPINSEISRLNIELLSVERVGLTFWLAVAATATSFIGSFMSCIICCRLPSSRHEDKEYKIMQLPTYSH